MMGGKLSRSLRGSASCQESAATFCLKRPSPRCEKDKGQDEEEEWNCLPGGLVTPLNLYCSKAKTLHIHSIFGIFDIRDIRMVI